MRNIYHSRMRALLDAINDLEAAAIQFRPEVLEAQKVLVSAAIRMVEALTHLDDEPSDDGEGK
jgi:hypothetical protein